jgi:hypothetical protein
MGYTTYFEGSVQVDPPLSAEEVAFLNKFSETRRMNRKNGPYFVDGTGDFGQGQDEDVIDHNSPDPSQPGLWCHWVASDDGSEIMWDDGEKFYEAEAWMDYIINHFVGPTPIAATELPFLKGHTVNGTISADGEESDDFWKLKVDGNIVYRIEGRVSFEDEPQSEPEPVDLTPEQEALARTRILIRHAREGWDEQVAGRLHLNVSRETFEIFLRDLEEASGIR